MRGSSITQGCAIVNICYIELAYGRDSLFHATRSTMVFVGGYPKLETNTGSWAVQSRDPVDLCADTPFDQGSGVTVGSRFVYKHCLFVYPIVVSLTIQLSDRMPTSRSTVTERASELRTYLIGRMRCISSNSLVSIPIAVAYRSVIIMSTVTLRWPSMHRRTKDT